MAVIAWISVDQAIDPHQDARPATEVLETVDPVSVLVGLLHAHVGSVAQELQAQCEIGCGSERVGTPTRYLETSVKLRVNPAKSRVAPMSECGFLGFTIRGTKIRWTDKALANFKHRVRELTGRSWGVSMDYRLHKLGQYVRGWAAYFGISQYYRPVPELDDWIRRRLRMCYWKPWRWARTKIRHLLDLGVRLKPAIQHAVSSKSYWRMARTPALQQALSNAWLTSQGLVSVKDMWCKARGTTP